MGPTNICFEDEYIRENLYSGKRIPIFLRNHIRDCDRCQEKVKMFHFEKLIRKRFHKSDNLMENRTFRRFPKQPGYFSKFQSCL